MDNFYTKLNLAAITGWKVGDVNKFGSIGIFIWIKNRRKILKVTRWILNFQFCCCLLSLPRKIVSLKCILNEKLHYFN
jgi:hypothetical protein